MTKEIINEKESEHDSLIYAQRTKAMLRCLKTVVQDDDFSPDNIIGAINILTKFCLSE